MENKWVIVASVESRDRAGAYMGALASALNKAKKETAMSRIVPVVLDAHRPWWAGVLADVSDENIVVEPFDRGTAAGILVAVVRILRSDPKADVVIIGAESAEEVVEGSVQTLIGLFQSSQPKLLQTYLTELAGPALFSDDALSSVYPFLPEVPFFSVIGADADTSRAAS